MKKSDVSSKITEVKNIGTRLGTSSMVFAILGLVLAFGMMIFMRSFGALTFTFFVNIPFGIAGLILTLSQQKFNPTKVGKISIWLNILQLVLGIIGLLIVIIFVWTILSDPTLMAQLNTAIQQQAVTQ